MKSKTKQKKKKKKKKKTCGRAVGCVIAFKTPLNFALVWSIKGEVNKVLSSNLPARDFPNRGLTVEWGGRGGGGERRGRLRIRKEEREKK